MTKTRPEYRGIYPRGKNGILWLRWCPTPGEQHRVSLDTTDYNIAAEKAKAIRKNPALVNIGTWDQEKMLYYAERIATKKFTQTTTTSTDYVIKTFSEFCKVSTPAEVTEEMAFAFFRRLQTHGFQKRMKAGTKRKTWRFTKEAHPASQATMVTYQARLSGFFNWLKRNGKVEENWLAKVPLDPIDAEDFSRKDYLPPKEIKILIKETDDTDMQFVFYCGFHAGMRKDEIINATPAWFNLRQDTITIPSSQDVEGRRWRPKSKKTRHVPLSQPFKTFLQTKYKHAFEQPFMLMRKGKGFGAPQRYRYDFRRPYEQIMTAHEIGWLTAHNMRHSFGSNCLISGIPIATVAGYLGDQIRTVEKHYKHQIPRKGELDAVYN